MPTSGNIEGKWQCPRYSVSRIPRRHKTDRLTHEADCFSQLQGIVPFCNAHLGPAVVVPCFLGIVIDLDQVRTRELMLDIVPGLCILCQAAMSAVSDSKVEIQNCGPEVSAALLEKLRRRKWLCVWSLCGWKRRGLNLCSCGPDH